MYSSGHLGISIGLSAPVIAVLLFTEQYISAIIFFGLIFSWSSMPDVDIYLKKYELGFRSYPIYHWIWIPVIRVATFFMNIAGNYIDSVPESYNIKKVQHRGITHTLWFALSVGFWLLFVMSLFFVTAISVELLYDYPIATSVSSSVASTALLLFIVPLAGFLSVCYHCAGDAITPMGIRYLTPSTRKGFTLDFFRAKNKIANRSAIPLGSIFILYVLFVWLSWEISMWLFIGILALLYIIIPPFWILFVTTPIGKWFYKIYDALR